MTWRLTGIVLFTLATSLPAQADVTREIDHLLGFIEESGCTFVRNGDAHDSVEARKHIEKKYDYAGRWIETAEQFVEYTATRSSISGERYVVNCGGYEQPSAEWLLSELDNYRSTSGAE
jgi:hypothetical protein